MKIVLNLGAGQTPLQSQTSFFQGWNEIRIDLAEQSPHLVDDIRTLANVPNEYADAIWACHVVEHIHWHDLPMTFQNIMRVLKSDGIAVIRVPDLGSIADKIQNGLNDKLYQIGDRIFTPMDIIYGHRDYFGDNERINYATCHKIGFTEKSLTDLLRQFKINGFTQCRNYEIMAVLYKDKVPNLNDLNF